MSGLEKKNKNGPLPKHQGVPVGKPIEGLVLGGKVIIQDPEDVRRARFDFRITGALVGGLPDFKMQTQQHGAPLLLSKPELFTLKKYNLIRLKHSEFSSAPAKNDEIASSSPSRDSAEKRGLSQVKGDEGSQIQNGKDSSENGGRGTETAEIRGGTPPLKKQKTTTNHQHPHHPDDASTKSAEIPVENGVENPSSNGAENPCENGAENPSESGAESDASEATRCVVFEDLWLRGFRVSNGSGFGGDFLAYPGPSNAFHAQFVVRCVKGNFRIHALDLISMCRVAHGTKKVTIVASVAEGNTVDYARIDWETLKA